MPKITGSAIEFFSKIEFNNLATMPQPDEEFIVHLPRQYPVAWEAIKHLNGLMDSGKQEIQYPSINKREILVRELKSKSERSNFDNQVIVESGMDPLFDKSTIDYFRYIKNNPRMPFFSDSFKAITRNIDKLFQTLEFFLRINSPVVTFNFYIENGYVAMRKNWVKPLHNTSEVSKMITKGNFKSCVPKHKHILGMVKNQVEHV